MYVRTYICMYVRMYVCMYVGKRDRGALCKRFKDQLKRQFTQAGIEHSKREHLAKGREEWKMTIKSAASGQL